MWYGRTMADRNFPGLDFGFTEGLCSELFFELSSCLVASRDFWGVG